jgi:mannose-1-phosphate guanylyltransferase
MSTKIVILAGGVGSRFFPLSTSKKPKQFLKLFSDSSMLSETFDRVMPIVSEEDVYLVTNENFSELVYEDLPRLKKEHCVWEPVGRNTAPALGLACLRILKDDPDAVIVSLHSDHFIRKEAKFLSIVQTAAEIAQQDKIVILGVVPTYPETGYGYIQTGEEIDSDSSRFSVYEVNNFKEKPDFETAQNYVMDGHYLWNAGMFVFKASNMMEQFKIHEPELYKGLLELEPYIMDTTSEDFKTRFAKLKSISIDVAVMERASNICVMSGDVGWSDVGSYQSLHQLCEKDMHGNVLRAEPNTTLDLVSSKNNLVITESKGKKIGLVGVRDLMIVDTEDYLLIGELGDSQDVKRLKQD